MTNDISKLDDNFAQNKDMNIGSMRICNVREAPFEIYGLYNPLSEGRFVRMPIKTAKRISSEVESINYYTAGARVRFKTDSEFVAIRCKMDFVNRLPRMPMTGSCGFDIYADGVYANTFVPPAEFENGYESVVHFGNCKIRDIIINFPLYNTVSELYIGIGRESVLLKGNEYYIKKPIVYYGSSITNGGCASRPGNAYQSIISRKLDCNYVNLGFTGNAKAEDEVAEYISSLDMSVFVYDYDHNAPSNEYLMQTHQRMFQKIRIKNPNLPIVIISRPDVHLMNNDDKIRRDTIYTTYATALKNGDRNVYFIDGQSFFSCECGDCCTVDGIHPNDFGFVRMAEVISSVIKPIISL